LPSPPEDRVRGKVSREAGEALSPRRLFHAFFLSAAFLFAAQGAAGVTAHLTGVAVSAGVFLSVFRFFFRFINLARKPGNLNKGHVNSSRLFPFSAKQLVVKG
jgi:hypothetical protein